ncbi:dockerin type I domain-containing protein [Novipirellula artificiosorum]|uniref:Uncharacterized protein n=1 Tax=Novipirellula artificiosorum TaxID=2528016 RepID=A0A5C6D4S5_9BACT|nr:dockerin type I domain-containing protein [Novipirellula artificiosorum]TWU31778.1 hypothetical protein Poly41_60130 [Novipirellula artificiosorum]
MTLQMLGASSGRQRRKRARSIRQLHLRRHHFRILLLETLEERHLLSATPLDFHEVADALRDDTIKTATVVTHGFQLAANGGDSLIELADAISARVETAYPDDPVWFLDYDIPDEGQTGVFDGSKTTLPDASSESGHVVLLFDWSVESNEASAGWGAAAGEALFTMLVGLGIVDVDPAPTDPNPTLHFIGHSFGTAVTSEAIERLARFEVPVDQVTYLDPHDFNQGIGFDGEQELSTLGLPAGYGATVWDNVEFADVYYQTEFLPDGRPIPGAFNTFVNDEVGGLHAHSNVWDEYYIGTVRDDTSTTGYAYSSVARSQASIDRPSGNFFQAQHHQHSEDILANSTPTEARLNTAATSDQLTRDDLVTGKWKPLWQPTTIANGTLKYGDDERDIISYGSNLVPGWSHHGGGGPAKAVEMPDGFLGIELTASDHWREHNRFYVAPDVGQIGFDVNVPVSSDTTDLLVRLVTADGGDVFENEWRFDLQDAFTQSISIPADHKNRVNRIRFELISDTEPIDATVQVHEVRLAPQTTIISGDFEIDGTVLLEYAGNVVFDATSVVTGKVDDLPDDLILDVEGSVTFLGQVSGLRDVIVNATDKIIVGPDAGGSDVIISTRKIASGDVMTAVSTGDSGDIEFTSEEIVLHSGAKLLAHVEDGSSHAPGDITLQAVDRELREVTLLSPLDVNTNAASIRIDGAEIQGGDIRMTADAVDTHLYGDLGAYSDKALESLVDLLDQIPDLAISSVFGISGQVAIHHADATITLTDSTITGAGSVQVGSNAKSDASLHTVSLNGTMTDGSFTVAVGYGEAHSTALTTIDNTQIVAGGPVDITSHAETEAFVKARTSSNLTGPSNPKNISLAAAVANTSETSHVTVSETANIISQNDSVNVGATGEVVNFAWSQPTIYEDGTVATAFSFGFDEADVTTRVDGTIDAAGGVGNTFDARDVNDASGLGDVDYDADTIRILNHGFTDGQQVRYFAGEADAPLGKIDAPRIGGLQDNSEDDEAVYYVQVIDDNTIQLAKAPTIELGTGNLRLGQEPQHAFGKLDLVSFDSSGVSPENETVTFAEPHGLQDDQAVTYLGPDQNEESQSVGVGGLEQGKTYYIITVPGNDMAIRLATSPGGELLDLTGPGVGAHAFLYESRHREFAPRQAIDDKSNTITFEVDHGFSTGDAVIYHTDPTLTSENTFEDEPVAELDVPIDGLSDGSLYFVVKSDDVTVRLVSSKKAALDAAAIDLQEAALLLGESPGDAHVLTSSRNLTGISVHASLDATNAVNANATITGEPFSWTNVGDADRMVQPEEIFGVISNLTDVAKNIFNMQPTKSPTQAGADFGIAGAIGINYADHDVQAIVGPTASLQSSKEIHILGEINEASQTVSVSDASKPEDADASASVAVAVGLGIFDNTAKSLVEGSVIDAGGEIAVDAAVDYGFLIANPWTAINPVDFLKQAGPAGFGYLNDGTLGFASNLFNTWVMTSASQSEVAGGGSFAVNLYDNTSEARIKNGARINTNEDSRFRTGNQVVGVDAAIDMDLIGVAGVGGLGLTVENLLFQPAKNLFTKDSPLESLKSLVNPFGAEGDKGGIGASFLVEVMNNATEAVIESGTQVYAGWARDFNPNTPGVIDDNWMTLTERVDLATGTELVYRADPAGMAIGNLVDGQTYFVILDEQDPYKIRLAVSPTDATAGTAIELQPGEGMAGLHRLLFDCLSVDANTDIFDLAIAQAGGKASSFAVAGAFAIAVQNNKTKAHIDSGAIVDADGTIHVSALDDLTRVGVTGGVVAGANVGVGVSVSVNDLTRITQAYIGTEFDPDSPLDTSADTGTTVTAAGAISVDALATGALWTASVAAAVTGTAPSEKELIDNERVKNAPAKAQTILGETGQTYELKVGVGVAGDVSVNILDEDTYAYLNDTGTITAGGQVDVSSLNDTALWSLAGSVAISLKGEKTSLGIAGSISVNNVTSDTRSFIAGATIGADSLAVLARRKGGIRSLTASGAGAPLKEGVALAGSVSVNVVHDTVEAYLAETTTSLAADSSVIAVNECQIWAIGGAAAWGGKAGVGVGVAVNVMGSDSKPNVTQAYIHGSTVMVTDGALEVSAANENPATDSRIIAITGSLGVGTGPSSFAGAGTLSVNAIANDTKAFVAGSTLTTQSEATTGDGGWIELNATDHSKILADAGAFSIALTKGKGLSLGAAIADNEIANETEVYIEDSNVTADGYVELAADSTATIEALTLAGVLTASASGDDSGVAGAVGGAGSSNHVANVIEACITGNSLITASAGDVTLTATDNSTIKADAGGFAFAFGAGKSTSGALSIGASFAHNEIENQVRAYISGLTVPQDANVAVVSAAGDVALLANSEAIIEAVTVGVAIAAGGSASGLGLAGSGAGALAHNEIANTVEAFTATAGTFATNGGDLKLTAQDDSNITARGYGGAIAVGASLKSVGAAAAVGLSIARNEIANTVRAAIDQTDLPDTSKTVVLPFGGLQVFARSNSSIVAKSLAASLSVGAGKNAGLAWSGGGAVSTNSITTDTNAYLKEVELESADDAVLDASNTSEIHADVVALAAALGASAGTLGGAAAIGASVARNYIGYDLGGNRPAQGQPQAQVRAYVENSDITVTSGGFTQVAIAAPTIRSTVASGSAAVAGSLQGGAIGSSGSGADARNRIAMQVRATIDAAADIDADWIAVITNDVSTISADVGAVALAASFALRGSLAQSIGVSLATNEIRNEVEAYIRGGSNVVARSGPVDLYAVEDASIHATSTAAAVSLAIAQGALAISGAGANATNLIGNRVHAFVDGSSVTTAVQDVIVIAHSTSSITAEVDAVSASAALGGIAVAGSVGVTIAENLIAEENEVLAYLRGSTVTSAGDVVVKAESTESVSSKSLAASIAVATAGPSASGAGTSTKNVLETKVHAYLQDTAVVASGDIEITAKSSSAIIEASAIGTAIGFSLAGPSFAVAVSTVENRIAGDVLAYASESETESERQVKANGNITIAAAAVQADVVDVSAVTASISKGSYSVSGGGIDINNTVENSVNAHITGDLDLVAAGQVSVSAVENASLAGDATTVSIAASLGAALGVALVHNEIASTILASVNQASVTSANTLISSESQANVEKTISAGISASALAAQGNKAKAVIKTNVGASTTHATLTSTGDISIVAIANNTANADATGGAFGAVAGGAMLADVSLGEVDEETGIILAKHIVEAVAGDDTKIQARALRITANTTDDLLAESIAAAGGVVAGAGAASKVTSVSETRADIGVNVMIAVDAFEMNARHDQDFDASADSLALALATGSGAEVANMIANSVIVDVAAGASVTAGSIQISAYNQLDKDRFRFSNNLRSGSVAAAGATLLASNTRIGNQAVVNVGTAASLQVDGDNAAPGVFRIEAVNDISALDSVRIETVSGYGAAVGVSEVIANTLAVINVNDATLESTAGDVYLTAKTDANIHSTANLLVATAVTGVSGAESTADANLLNAVNVDGATIKGRDIHLLAGRNSEGQINLIDTRANTELTTISMLPNIAIPKPTANVREDNHVKILGESTIQAIEDVYLVTDGGFGGADRRNADGVALSLSLIPYGFPIPSHGEDVNTNTVMIDDLASVEAGVNHHAEMLIKSVVLEGFDVTRLEKDLSDRLLSPAEKVDEGLEDTDSEYEYIALQTGQIAFNVFDGTVVQVVEDEEGEPVAGNGEVGGLYRYTAEIEGAVQVVLHAEDYEDPDRWEKIQPDYDLNDPPENPVDLNTDQIVRTEDDMLFQFVGADGTTVDFGNETFEDPTQWIQLVPAIYRSDMARAYVNVLKNKFYVVKPTKLDPPTMSLQDMGGLLVAQRARILDWITNHSSNAEAVARYQIQLELVDRTLMELGLMEIIVDPDTGEAIQIVNEGLDVLFVDLPDIYAAPGSIFIEADTAYQDAIDSLVQDQLVAQAGAGIRVSNQSPFSMTVGDAVIGDTRRAMVVDGEYVVLSPGNVYFNGEGLTQTEDPPDKTIVVTQEPASRECSDYGLDPCILESVSHDVYVLGEVVNESGDVVITNLDGSINVAKEIRGENVRINAGLDFNLNTDDWFHNSDPRQSADFDYFRQQVYNPQGALTTNAYSERLFSLGGGELVATLSDPTLDDPTLSARDGFGYAVAGSGNTMFVGVPDDDNGEEKAGVVYIFDVTTGTLLDKLVSPEPQSGANFGTSVAVSGSTLVVGEPRRAIDGRYPGAAYVYDLTSLDAAPLTLEGPDSPDFPEFGQQVAIAENTIVVAATIVEAVYIFDATTGDLLQTLLNPEQQTGTFFGESIAVSEDKVVVGAPGRHNNTNSGAAYVFDLSNPQAAPRILENPDFDDPRSFGISVAVSGDRVLVGASENDDRAGTAYVFDVTTGLLQQRLKSPEPQKDALFGHSVAMSDDTVVVGALLRDVNGAVDIGTAFVYDLADPRTGPLVLDNPTPTTDDSYAWTVATWDNLIAVGSFNQNIGGEVHVFGNRSEPPSSAIRAEGRVAVTAKYLNINGLIQSGVQTVTLHVAPGFSSASTTSLVDRDGNPLQGIYFGGDGVPVDGYVKVEGEDKRIIVDDIVPAGGEIFLAGQILSTGGGQLDVAHGYANVDIDNQSDYELVVNRIDTTKKRPGKVTIVDTARLQKVEYVIDEADGQRVIWETVYQGAPGEGNGAISGIVYDDGTSQDHSVDAPLVYQPRGGLQYVWTEGQEKSTITKRTYEDRSFNLLGFDWDGLVSDRNLKSIETFNRDEYPLLESEVLAAPPDYDLTLLSEDFNDGDVEVWASSSNPYSDRWTVVDQVANQSSDWHVTSGRLTQSSNIYSWLDPARLGTYLYYDASEALRWKDYELNVDVHGTDDDGVGVLFHYTDRDNYYKLDMDAQRGFTRLFKVKNGVQVTIEPDSSSDWVSYMVNVKFHLTLQVRGNETVVLIDGEEVRRYSDSDLPLTSGTVALYCWGQEGVTFDNLNVHDLSPPLIEQLTPGQVVKVGEGGLYRYQGPVATDVDLGAEDFRDSSRWTADVEPPAYADGTAYTIQYVLQKDTDVELIPNVTVIEVVVDFNEGGVVGHKYLYVGDPDEVVLSEQDYSDTDNWEDVTGNTAYPNATYTSDFVNSTHSQVTTVSGGGWLRYKTVRTITTDIVGEKDYYTHTLAADLPVAISFLHGSTTPSINIVSAQDLSFRRTVSSPSGGTVSFTSVHGDMVFADAAAVLGTMPTIRAEEGSLRANIEGAGPTPGTLSAEGLGRSSVIQSLNLTAKDDIDIRAVYDPLGNQSRTFIVGQVISTDGNVILHAPDGIYAFDGSSLVSGNRIELDAGDGGVGNADRPLLVDSDLLGSGGVAANADQDIFLRELTGDLRLVQPQSWQDVRASVYSAYGNVELRVDSGSIIDAFYEEFEPRTQEEIDASNKTMQLTGDLAREAAETAIRSEEIRQTQLYHDYWRHYRKATASGVARETAIAVINEANDEVHTGLPHQLQTGDELFFRFGLDLTNQDYTDATRWQAKPDFDLATLSPGQLVDLEIGQIIRATRGVLYRFSDVDAEDVELGAENFDNFLRWVEITPDYDLQADWELQTVTGPVDLEPGQQVKTLDGKFYRYQGAATEDVDLNSIDFTNAQDWLEITAASGAPARVNNGSLVATADGGVYEYRGGDLPDTNLHEELAYYAVVKTDTTLQLASSRYGAVLAGQEEGGELVDLLLGSGSDFGQIGLIEYSYEFLALNDPELADVPEEFQTAHETYGNGQYDPGFVFQLSSEERLRRLEARTFDSNSLSSPVADSLFGFLFPTSSSIGDTSTATEQTNILGLTVTLVTPAGAIGRVEQPMEISLTNGFEQLGEQERRALAAAAKEDVMAVHYAVYQYLGEAQTVDLGEANFEDPSLWAQQQPHHVTTGDTQVESVDTGDVVQVTIPQNDAGEPQFGIYRYLGQAARPLDLSLQNYRDASEWQALAEFDTSEGELELGTGARVGRLESLTIDIWNDVDVHSENGLVIQAWDHVAVGSPDDLPIDSITANGAVRVRSLGDLTLNAAGGSFITSVDAAVTLQSGGHVLLSEASRIVAETSLTIAGGWDDAGFENGVIIQILGQFDAADAEILGGINDDTIYVHDFGVVATDARAGYDELHYVGLDPLTLNTATASHLFGIESLILDGSTGSQLDFLSDALTTMVGNGVLRLTHDAGDPITYTGDWTIDAPAFDDGLFVHILHSGAGTLEIANTRPWQNPLDIYDVGYDGSVSAIDALRIINRLADPDSELPTPSQTDNPFRYYYDVTGDNRVTALDALKVINRLAVHSNASPEGESADSNHRTHLFLGSQIASSDEDKETPLVEGLPVITELRSNPSAQPEFPGFVPPSRASSESLQQMNHDTIDEFFRDLEETMLKGSILAATES